MLALSDNQLRTVMAAARGLPAEKRDLFLSNGWRLRLDAFHRCRS
jgi:hypothetical protein